MNDQAYVNITDYELLETAKQSFSNISDDKVDSVVELLNGMETFDGAAVLSVALMSILSSSAPSKKSAAIAVSAYFSIMLGFLSQQKDEEFKQ
jgi:hypothetical protein